ncbi:unnamed protein product [Brassica oleracea]
MEKTILGNLEWQYMFLVLFITASMSDPKATVIQVSINMHSPNGFKHILID